MSSIVYPFQIGDFQCVALVDGGRTMPIEQMFPAVSREKLNAVVAAHKFEQEVPASMNVLAVNTGEQWVLVDTGLGNGRLSQSLQTAHIDLTDIGTIIITHGDGDHIGGIDNFPNAQFVLARQSWKLWTSENGRSQMVDEWMQALGHRLPEEARPQHAANRARYGTETLPSLQAQGRLLLVEPETEFLPGFKLVDAPGHRSDHMAVEIKSGSETLLHVADAFRHPMQAIHPEWGTLFDSDAQVGKETAVSLFQRASDHKALVFATHFAFPGLLRISQTDAQWVWQTMT